MDGDSDCANPLLLQWLGEWLDEARQRNSKGVQTYKKAYDSMKACPLPFDHPSQAQQLHGLGPKLCDRLTAKWTAHCKDQGIVIPAPSQAGQKRSTSDVDPQAAPTKKARPSKPYVPVFRSGPYAILNALSSAEEGSSQSFAKDEVIALAQPHCDSSFTAPSDPTKYFTAWNSMKALIEKDFVYERGRPLRRYALTDHGWDVARRLKKPEEARQSQLPTSKRAQNQTNSSAVNHTASVERVAPHLFSEGSDLVEWRSSPPVATDHDARQPQQLGERAASGTVTGARSGSDGQSKSVDRDSITDEAPFPPTFEAVVLAPSSFTVHLVLDTREVRAKQDRAYMQEELTRRGVTPIMRTLEAGDALWIAKGQREDSAERPSEDRAEVVLDWIVERKRLDDLVGSIKDGRFREQKFRLRRSGVKNVIYIIEDIGTNNEAYRKYQEATESAIASTQVVDGYFVKRTQTVDDTIRYLARMTMLLKSVYESKPLHVVPARVLTPQNYLPLLSHLEMTEPSREYHISYTAFAHLASKSDFLTLRDIYLKMLMCTKGLTGDKALEIQRRWSTPVQLIDAFGRCGNDDAGRPKRLNLIVDELNNLVGRKKIGKPLSQKIADVWGCV